MPRIPYYDKHPAIGGTLQYLTLKEYKAKFNCVYVSDMIVPQDLNQDLQGQRLKNMATTPEEGTQDYLKHFITNPREDIAIVNLGSSIGYGLIAIKPIQENDILCAYSGEVKKLELVDNDEYRFVFENTNLCISAKRIGGLSRFFPHMWNEEDAEFKEIEFLSADIKNQVKTCNTVLLDMNIDGKCYKIIFSKSAIEAGELLGLNYGKNFWLNAKGERPKLLLKDGTILDQKFYWRSAATFKIPIIHQYKSKVATLVTLNRQQCFDLIRNPEPATLGEDKQPFSKYHFRDMAVNSAVVDECYAHIDHHSFVLMLKEKLKDSAEIKAYLRQPVNNENRIDNYTVDVVVMAKNTKMYHQILVFLEPIKDRILQHDKTLEIVIKGVNVESENEAAALSLYDSINSSSTMSNTRGFNHVGSSNNSNVAGTSGLGADQESNKILKNN